MTDDNRTQVATDALERLGLTSYEAQAFVALHRLGAGPRTKFIDCRNCHSRGFTG